MTEPRPGVTRVAPPVQSGPAAPAPQSPTAAEVFPHVRIDRASRTVEVDARSACDVPAGSRAAIFLEVLACNPNTREHESLLVTLARPSHVHAALLLVGLQPGATGAWKFEDKALIPVEPRGDAISVVVRWNDAGTEHRVPITDWVFHAGAQRTLTEESRGSQRWVFAGSTIVHRGGVDRYAADASGTVIGLTSFGDEPLAWSGMYSPEAAVDEPQWIARPGHVPARETPVIIELSPAPPRP